MKGIVAGIVGAAVGAAVVGAICAARADVTYEEAEQLAGTVEATITAVAILAAGLWAYYNFGLSREAHPHIEFTADINFIDGNAEWWVVELISYVENKGKVQHQIRDFTFSLDGLGRDNSIDLSERYGRQVHFPHSLARGTWLPKRDDAQPNVFFFIEPGVKAKYSYVARVPKTMTAVMLHSRFQYPGRKAGHTAERTVRCPDVHEPLPSAVVAQT